MEIPVTVSSGSLFLCAAAAMVVTDVITTTVAGSSFSFFCAVAATPVHVGIPVPAAITGADAKVQ